MPKPRKSQKEPELIHVPGLRRHPDTGHLVVHAPTVDRWLAEAQSPEERVKRMVALVFAAYEGREKRVLLNAPALRQMPDAAVRALVSDPALACDALEAFEARSRQDRGRREGARQPRGIRSSTLESDAKLLKDAAELHSKACTERQLAMLLLRKERKPVDSKSISQKVMKLRRARARRQNLCNS